MTLNSKLQPTSHPKSFTAEVKELDAALNELQSNFQASLEKGEDITLLQQQMSELEATFEQHQIRLQQKIADVKEIFGYSRKDEEEKIEQVKELLGDDFSLIMLHTLSDELVDVREVSAVALKGTRDPACIEKLCEHLLNDPEGLVGFWSGHALAGLHDKKIEERLRVYGLKSENSEVRVHAAIALKGTSNPACIKTLCELVLYDKEDTVKNWSAEALQGTKHKKTLTLLCEIGLGEKNHPDGRLAAARALFGTKDPDCIAALKAAKKREWVPATKKEIAKSLKG